MAESEFLTAMPATAPRRIVFTGDFLRASPYYWRPTQHFNAQWLKQLFGEALRQATGLPSDLVMWNHDSVQNGQLDGQAIARIHEAFGVPCNVQGWVRIFNEGSCPPQVEALLRHLFRDALVIGFEMPPMVEAVLQRAGIPYVDVINHPVRFLDDLMFGMRSNLAPVGQALAARAVPENYLRLMGSIQAAAAGRLFRRTLVPDSALFLMQMEHDRSQVDGQRFVGVTEFMGQIGEIAKRHDKLYVKAHPLAPKAPQTMAILGQFPNAERIEANFYTLCASDAITRVAAMSSSTVTEAGYFGTEAEYVFKPPFRFALDGAMPEPGEYVGLYNHYLAPDFWRGILGDVMATTPTDGITVPEKPNRLRLSLREFWNFNEIDTDFATELWMRKHGKD